MCYVAPMKGTLWYLYRQTRRQTNNYYIVYTVRPLKMVIAFKHHPDISTKKLRSRIFPGFCNVKKFGFKRPAY